MSRLPRFCAAKSPAPAIKPTVAVVGASTDPTRWGHRAVLAYLRDGWEVYPIHPSAREIAGLRSRPSLLQVPERLVRVTLYLPPAIGLRVLPDIAAVWPDEFYVNPGAESEELLAAAAKLGLRPIQACSILALRSD
ncbi:MAG: CoA-binding protein [Fimbriimonadaceae bacterium]|nr:CoA-binding protein [Fimbriimonadaceae bacterium]